MNIIITSPSLDSTVNVSGISSVTSFIIDNNPEHNYIHFKLGRGDHDKRKLLVALKILKAYSLWLFLMIFKKNIFIHFNLPLEKRSIIRDVLLILTARFLRKRMLIHLHGGEYLMKKNGSHWIDFIIKIILTGNETKIALSQIEKDSIIKKYSATNVEVLANCPDLTEAQKYKRIYLHQNPLRLLFMGRIVERKGLHVIFYALKLLKEKGISFKFYLAGAGHDEVKYVNKFNELLGTSFEFKGVVTGKMKSELMSCSDIFLLPSLCGEGLPMSLLESMSFEIAPIVTNDGSMSNVIKSGENGILVEKGSVSSLENAILSFINDKMFLEKIAKNARNYVFENHDATEYIKQLNTLYGKDYS